MYVYRRRIIKLGSPGEWIPVTYFPGLLDK